MNNYFKVSLRHLDGPKNKMITLVSSVNGVDIFVLKEEIKYLDKFAFRVTPIIKVNGTYMFSYYNLPRTEEVLIEKLDAFLDFMAA